MIGALMRFITDVDTDRDISYTRKLHAHFAIQYIQYIMT